MPLYDYKCDLCGEVEEFIHGMKDSISFVKCAQCGSSEMKRFYANQRVQMTEVYHGHYDKLENRGFSTKREMKEYGKVNGKIFASNEDINFECNKNKKDMENKLLLKRVEKINRAASKIASMGD